MKQNRLDSSNFEWTKFLRGKVEILQPLKGARFSIDSVILAGLTFVREGESVIDLGCGSGIIMLLLTQFYHPSKISGIEIQQDLFYCATETLEKSSFDNFNVIKGDFRNPSNEKFDVVISNPPYYEKGKGKESPDLRKKLSYLREDMPLETFFICAKEYLKDEGRFSFILPYSLKNEAILLLRKIKLYPYLIRGIKHKEDENFVRFVALCSKKEKKLIELPPLFIKDENNVFSEEVKNFLGETPFRKEPSFFCDSMLFRLAKYLRFFGIDCAFLKDANDDFLLKECLRSGRILISLDRELLGRFKKRKLNYFEPSSFNPKKQFNEVLKNFDIEESIPKRCLNCNSKVIKIEKEKIEGLVPQFTFKTHNDFFVCPSCSKITWGGTHLERFKKEVLEDLKMGEKDE